MDIREFEELIQKAKTDNPKMFDLDSDNKPSIEYIKSVEKYYGIVFPASYNDFLLRHGGGYFAYTVVYSLDEQSPFYVLNKVAIEFVKTNNFFPVIDFETGDVAGFKIDNCVCEDSIILYDHEKKVVRDLKMGFYDSLVKFGLKS